MPSTLTNLLYHIVFSTKRRENLIDPGLRRRLYPYIGGVLRGERARVLKIGGTANHVHLLARIPPSISVSEMLRRVKGNSSRWVNDRPGFAWQRGYAAFSVSESGGDRIQVYRTAGGASPADDVQGGIRPPACETQH